MSNNFYLMILVGVILVAQRSADPDLANNLAYRGSQENYGYQSSRDNYRRDNYQDNSYVTKDIELKIKNAFRQLDEAFENGLKTLQNAFDSRLKKLSQKAESLEHNLKTESTKTIGSIEQATKNAIKSVTSLSQSSSNYGKDSFAHFVEQQKSALQSLISGAIPKFKYYIKQCKKYDSYGDDQKNYGKSYDEKESDNKYSEISTDKYSVKYESPYGDDNKQYNEQESKKYVDNDADAYNSQSKDYYSHYIKKTPAYKIDLPYSVLRPKNYDQGMPPYSNKDDDIYSDKDNSIYTSARARGRFL